MDIATTIIIAALTALVTSFIPEIIKHYLSIRTSATTRQQEIIKEQKYNYFLPFKNQAEELLNRVIHIEKRLEQKQQEMISHLQISYENKNLDWYFKDWENLEEKISGGYFLTSTLYMNCILYKKMSLMQEKFPFIEVEIKKSLAEIANDKKDEKFQKYIQVKQEDVIQEENLIPKWANLKGDNINLNRVIQAIRTSTIMRHGEGIYYGLHYSFGDFVTDDKGIINYEKFCLMLIDDSQRVKFKPLINFWTGLIDKEGNINAPKLDRIRALIIALKLVEVSNLK